jgi:hypothetical protein
MGYDKIIDTDIIEKLKEIESSAKSDIDVSSQLSMLAKTSQDFGFFIRLIRAKEQGIINLESFPKITTFIISQEERIQRSKLKGRLPLPTRSSSVSSLSPLPRPLEESPYTYSTDLVSTILAEIFFITNDAELITKLDNVNGITSIKNCLYNYKRQKPIDFSQLISEALEEKHIAAAIFFLQQFPNESAAIIELQLSKEKKQLNSNSQHFFEDLLESTIEERYIHVQTEKTSLHQLYRDAIKEGLIWTVYYLVDTLDARLPAQVKINEEADLDLHYAAKNKMLPLCLCLVALGIHPQTYSLNLRNFTIINDDAFKKVFLDSASVYNTFSNVRQTSARSIKQWKARKLAIDMISPSSTAISGRKRQREENTIFNQRKQPPQNLLINLLINDQFNEAKEFATKNDIDLNAVTITAILNAEREIVMKLKGVFSIDILSLKKADGGNMLHALFKAMTSTELDDKDFEKKYDMVIWLVEQGVDPYQEDNKKITAIDLLASLDPELYKDFMENYNEIKNGEEASTSITTITDSSFKIHPSIAEEGNSSVLASMYRLQSSVALGQKPSPTVTKNEIKRFTN